MGRPRVKALVWDFWDGGMTVAKTAIGTYNLSQNFRLCFPSGSYRYYETEEAAKAAAQADYEARILAALEPVTVRTCAKCGHPENNHPYRHPFVSIAQKGADSG